MPGPRFQAAGIAGPSVGAGSALTTSSNRTDVRDTGDPAAGPRKAREQVGLAAARVQADRNANVRPPGRCGRAAPAAQGVNVSPSTTPSRRGSAPPVKAGAPLTWLRITVEMPLDCAPTDTV